jgi:predicted nucleic acid-binding protein
MIKTRTLVLDASVLLQPVLGQDKQMLVRKILFGKDNFEFSILVPDIFRYEFNNVVRRRVSAEAASRGYEAITDIQLSIIPLERDLIGLANGLMAKYPKISFYDAAYHAVARAYLVDYITADNKYYQLTKAEGDVKLLKDLKL